MLKIQTKPRTFQAIQLNSLVDLETLVKILSKEQKMKISLQPELTVSFAKDKTAKKGDFIFIHENKVTNCMSDSNLKINLDVNEYIQFYTNLHKFRPKPVDIVQCFLCKSCIDVA